MKYIELEIVKLKSILNEDIKLEIISFLSSYTGVDDYDIHRAKFKF